MARQPLPVDRRPLSMLKAAGVARTDADALRLLHEYDGQPVLAIIRAEKRTHHYLGPWRRAWRRFRRIW